MARGNVLGRSGTGKSWFSGWLLERILEPGQPDGGIEEVQGEEHEEPELDLEDGEFDMDVRRDDGDDETPNFGEASEAFDYAVHFDLEDEERGLSMVDDPLLLTYEADSESIRKTLKFRDPPDWIPDEELADGPEVLLPKAMLYKNRYIRVVPDGLSREEEIILLEMLADAAMKAGDCFFSVDEAHLYAKKHSIGDNLMRLVTGGRKRGVEWLFITQRPQKIHEDILSQSDYSVYFNLNDRDRDKAAEKSEAMENAEDKIEALDDRQALVEDFGVGRYAEVDTNELERTRPHVSGDDGKADKSFDGLF